MHMNKDGRMSNCPMQANSSSICQMNTTEHITKWQALFTATTRSSNLFLLIALLTVAFIYIMTLKRRTNLQSSSYFSYKYTLYKLPEVKLFNYLLAAFSDGIIHPKLYE